MDRRDSPDAATIRQNMLAGTIGPKEITINVVDAHIKESTKHGARAFVLDGELGVTLYTLREWKR
ncbi:hypothetical protein VB005_08469 [Metarhizium brunneum]